MLRFLILMSAPSAKNASDSDSYDTRFSREQQGSSGEQEREITRFSQRVPLYARAPTRIDLAGGWTDLIPFARENEGGW